MRLLCVWIKPDTGEKRIYFNGVFQGLRFGLKVKVFAVENQGAFDIKFSWELTPHDKNTVIDNIVEKLLILSANRLVTTWSHLLALAESPVQASIENEAISKIRVTDCFKNLNNKS